MRLLIVDDEHLIRDNMSAYLRQHPIGFSHVMTASDGLKGLQIAMAERPDIIISDIVMPGIDGIELIRKIRMDNQDCAFIMISGHEEIDYVRQAMRFEALDYLLKPIDLMELDAALVHAVNQLVNHRKLMDTLNMMQQQLDLNRSISISQIYHNLAAQNWLSLDDIREQLDFYKIKLALDQPMACICLGISTQSGIASFRERELLKMLMLQTTDNVMIQQQLNGLSGLVSQLMLGIIINLPDRGDPDFNVLDLVGAIQSSICDKVGQPVIAGIGPVCDSYTDLPDGCREALRAALEAAMRKNDPIVMYDQLIPVAPDFLNSFDLLHFMKEIDDKPTYQIAKELLSKYYADHLDGQLRLFKNNKRKNTASQKLIDACLTVIRDRYHEPVNLQTTAYELDVSPNYLGTLFKETTGQNFSAALINRRLAIAEELLKTAQVTISQISEQAGFEDSNYFAKVFRKKFQLSPSEYRERVTL